MTTEHYRDPYVIGFDDGPLHVNFDHEEVTINGTPVVLTTTEYRFLDILVRHHGQVLSSEQLGELAWDQPQGGSPTGVHYTAQRLRQKLRSDEDGASPIETVRGFGYRYRPGPGATTQRASVLIFEPEADLLQGFRELVEPLGFEVVEAVEGLDGTGQIDQVKPRLVILDATLHSIDGWQIFARVLHESAIPAIMIGNEHDKALGPSVDADDFVVLTKPFSHNELLFWVRVLTRR
jgi:DNA-binding response OmpR family regulator